MRYALIREMDISNGKGIGVSLFTQGCRFHCKGCFNEETWSFNEGKEWDENSKEKLLELADKPFIKRISILGGEPLSKENFPDILDLLKEVKRRFPDKDIWLYTGWEMESILSLAVTDDFNPERDEYLKKRKEAISLCDIVVDGRYVEELRDITLKWRGSSNQQIWKQTSPGEWTNTTEKMG